MVESTYLKMEDLTHHQIEEEGEYTTDAENIFIPNEDGDLHEVDVETMNLGEGTEVYTSKDTELYEVQDTKLYEKPFEESSEKGDPKVYSKNKDTQVWTPPQGENPGETEIYDPPTSNDRPQPDFSDPDVNEIKENWDWAYGLAIEEGYNPIEAAEAANRMAMTFAQILVLLE
jgi:hypothetical protein